MLIDLTTFSMSFVPV